MMTRRIGRPRTGHPAAAIALGVVAALLAVTPCRATPPPTSPPPARPDEADGPRKVPIVLGGERFELELAADPAARTRGLMGRESIPEHGGMLFVFPRPGYRAFWMAECLVEIDIAFLDVRGVIVAIHRMAIEPPRRADESPLAYERRLPRYPSIRPAQYAIELRAGTMERLGLRPGTRVELDRRELTAIARRNERRRTDDDQDH